MRFHVYTVYFDGKLKEDELVNIMEDIFTQ